jgi:hypothetical protein
MLSHRHAPEECGPAFAAWKGFDSPLRGRFATGSCGAGGHALWWTVAARDEGDALAMLPPYLATRTVVAKVDELRIP